MTQALTYALETTNTSAPLSARQGLWAAAMLASAEELASVALGQAECSVELVSGPAPANHVGSYLALVGANQAHQLAVLADRAGCTALAKALLGMTEDEDLPMGDVGDGMCEIANILAGGVKRRLVDSERLELGLPIFVDGRVEAKDQIETLLLRLTVCSVQATIAMMSKCTDSGAAR